MRRRSAHGSCLPWGLSCTPKADFLNRRERTRTHLNVDALSAIWEALSFVPADGIVTASPLLSSSFGA